MCERSEATRERQHQQSVLGELKVAPLDEEAGAAAACAAAAAAAPCDGAQKHAPTR